MQKIKINDTTRLGSWEEVEKISAADITKNENDYNILNGIILRGYETKFADGVNENGEMYSKNSIDNFIQRYFVDRKMNMPVDIEHDHRPEWLAGRVLSIENNDTGFYFISYIPKTFMHYNTVLHLLQEGILQGFSKEGYGEGEIVNEKGKEPYLLISKMDILRVSLVSMPANRNKFDNMQLTKNILQYRKFDNKSGNRNLYKPRYNPNHR